MLIAGMPLPTASDPNLMDKGDYERLHNLLREVRNFGVIVIDAESQLKSALSAGIKAWPVGTPRGEVGKLLVKLHDEGKIVALSGQGSLKPALNLCAPTLSLANNVLESKVRLDFLLVPPACGCDGACSPRQSICYPKESRSLQEDFSHVAGDVHLLSGDWSIENFSTRVWQRVFQFATNVQIIDGQIGKSLIKEVRQDRMTEPFESLLGNYAAGLEWICDEFVKHRRVTAPATIEVYTVGAIGGTKGDKLNALAKRVLSEFASRLGARSGIDLTFCLKDDHYGTEFLHDRYLFTENVAIQIGRGCDLIHPVRKKDGLKAIRTTCVCLVNYENRVKILTAAQTY